MRKVILILLSLFGVVVPAGAMQFENNEKILIGKERVLLEDYYAASEEMLFRGQALQDVFSASSTQTLMAGSVTGDLNVFSAGRAEIQTQVGDDCRVIASEVTLAGQINGSTILIGSRVTVDREAVCIDDAMVMGSDVYLAGNFKSTVFIRANRLTIDGLLEADVIVHAEHVTLGRNARILGQIKYDGKKELVIDSNAVIKQPLQSLTTGSGGAPATALAPDSLKSFLLAGKILYRFTLYIGLLIFGMLLLLVIPQPLRQYAQTLRYRPWASLGSGVLTGLGLFLVLLVMVISVIGIPFAIVTGLLALLVMFGAMISAGYLVGLLLIPSKKNTTGWNLLVFFVGFTLLSLLTYIPLFGDILNIIIILMGCGALWRVKGLKVTEEAVAIPEKVVNKKIAEQVVSSPSVKKEPVLAIPPIKPHAAIAIRSEWKPPIPAFKMKAKTVPTLTLRKKTAVKPKAGIKKKLVPKKVLRKTKSK